MKAAFAVTEMAAVAADVAEKENFLVTRFGALCFFLSTIEFVIPKPLPFLRLGIANIPLIVAADFFTPAAYFLLVFVKIIAQGIIGGTFFSWVFVFSAAGTMTSAAIMFLLKRALKTKISAVGLSVAGSFASNIAQLAVARAWIFGESISAVMPLLLGAGVATGFAVGLLTEFFAQQSLWLRKIKKQIKLNNVNLAASAAQGIEAASCKDKRKKRVLAALRIAVGFSFIVTVAFFGNVACRAAFFAFFYAALCLAGKRPRAVPVIVSMLAITAFNLFPPRGEILSEFAGLKIAKGSLVASLSRAFFFEDLIFISRWTFMQGKIQAFEESKERKKSGKLAQFLRRITSLLAETLALFEKLNSKPNAKKRVLENKVSLKAIAQYIDSVLQRIDA